MQISKIFLLLATAFLLAGKPVQAAEALWKAGVAATIITPEKPLWMAGYGGRTNVAQGTFHPLWIKVLALEDAAGHRAIVMSSDTLGIPKSIYDNTCAALKTKHGLERAQIMLHGSHTHCGPVLRQSLYDAYPIGEKEIEQVNAYSTELEQKIVQTVGEALQKLAPAKLSSGEGTTGFAVNRRNNLEPDVPKLIEANALKGPVDHAVPVLAVHDPRGKLISLVFGYACHNTTLSFNQWCGDYAGFAQAALERSHPGAVAMFYMGCGADQNPLPRREVSQAERYGQMLASAVEEVLLRPRKELKPELKTAFEMVTLNLGAEPTKEELQQMATGKTTGTTRWASRLLSELNAGKSLARTYPYPVQVWRLGGEQLWITLGGEVVVDYSLRFKREFGKQTWVAGYCNDLMAYIPSQRVLKEDVPPRASARWGYEGNTSMYVYGMPAHRWAEDIEDLIAGAVGRLVKAVTQ